MNARISTTIAEIKKRFIELKAALDEAEKKSETVADQLATLQAKFDQNEKLISSLESEKKELSESLLQKEEEKLEQLKQRAQEKDDKIDLLVQEIEQCIVQLKAKQ